ncbi:hypothetical protein [Georgfuchsia toluolica]|uniref:hypothetical protein n=1 Tax=Georgfuchsia toluolica TaxID=424218 RepID=UPI001C72C507|nr:hypothetical protein [Georgfuchsia toluolica]
MKTKARASIKGMVRKLSLRAFSAATSSLMFAVTLQPNIAKIADALPNHLGTVVIVVVDHRIQFLPRVL